MKTHYDSGSSAHQDRVVQNAGTINPASPYTRWIPQRIILDAILVLPWGFPEIPMLEEQRAHRIYPDVQVIIGEELKYTGLIHAH